VKWNYAISGCCLLLLATNIALIHQNSQLKARLETPPQMEATRGAQMPDLRGLDFAGKPVEVLYGKDPRKVLVLVYSPTCPFCDRNWPEWQAMLTSLDRSAVRTVAVDVSSSSSEVFIKQHKLAGLPVFQKVDPQATVNYRFQLTPQTILVDSTGKVEKVWSGVLNDSNLTEIQQLSGGGKTALGAHENHPSL